MTNYQLSNTVEYFLPGPSYDSDKKKSVQITQSLQRDFKDVFNGIGCFDGTFSYVVQKPFEEGLKRIQKHDIIAPLGVNETSEWCKSWH